MALVPREAVTAESFISITAATSIRFVGEKNLSPSIHSDYCIVVAIKYQKKIIQLGALFRA